MVCAAPGTGKSAVVLSYAVQARVPTLYFSADSDWFTQQTRTLSIQNGWTLEKSARAVRAKDIGPEAESRLDNLPIRFNYSASPSLEQLEDSMGAYEQGYGDFPHLVVVDNITNVRSGGDNDSDPFAGLESLMDYLHTMGRNTGACVIGLHHVTGEYNNGNKPIPLSGVKGQITRVPELILTMHRIEETFGTDSLRVSVCKNRGGKADASGASFSELGFIGDTMSIKDLS